jgi:hypothetical protein
MVALSTPLVQGQLDHDVPQADPALSRLCRLGDAQQFTCIDERHCMAPQRKCPNGHLAGKILAPDVNYDGLVVEPNQQGGRL